ncbi:hypothetical protein L0499_RS24635 [Escherichia coli]
MLNQKININVKSVVTPAGTIMGEVFMDDKIIAYFVILSDELFLLLIRKAMLCLSRNIQKTSHYRPLHISSLRSRRKNVTALYVSFPDKLI